MAAGDSGVEGWRLRFVLLLAGVFVAGTGSGVARPAVTYYLRYSLGATLLSATLLTSSFMLGRTLGSIISGAAGARAPGLRHVLAGLGLAGMGLAAYALSGSSAPWEVHLFTLAWGLLAGIAWPTVQVGVADLRVEASNTLLGVYFAVGSLGISAGNLLFGLLDLPYRRLILLGSLLLLASAIPVGAALRGLPRSGRSRGLPRGSAGRVFVLWVLGAAFGLGFLAGMLRDYFYLYAREALGLSRGALGGVLAAAGVLGMVSGVVMGALADRLGANRTLPMLVLAAMMGALMLSRPGLALAGYVLAALSVRASLPQTRNASLLPGGSGAALVGLSNSLSSIGMMTGPLVAGFLSGEKGLGAPYLAAAAVLGGLLVAYLLVGMKSR